LATPPIHTTPFSVHLFCEFCKEIWSEFFG